MTTSGLSKEQLSVTHLKVFFGRNEVFASVCLWIFGCFSPRMDRIHLIEDGLGAEVLIPKTVD